jgi:NAD(P)-dependent dehydrogenase (short-subunit alcohol dehydrogenase family)
MSEVWLITGASRGLGRAYGALSLSFGEVLGVEGK